MFRWRLAFIVPLAAMALVTGSAALPAKENALRPYRVPALKDRHAGCPCCLFGSLMGAGFASGQSLSPGDGGVSGPEVRDVSVNSACVG